ncbi:MAG TPA: hypothetical protein VEJ36_08360 [Nitrososphaerales archaeon]|nr:hypothetical protein [Nitrososphaerales archaeon]
MVRSRFSGIALALSLVALTLLAVPVHAQQTNWASTVSVRDLTANSVVPSGQPLLAGDSYNVTIDIAVPFSQSQTDFQATLNPALNLYGSQYWYVLTPNYPGYNQQKFTPGSTGVTFTQDQGQLTLAALFTVPAGMTVDQVQALTLRFAQSNFPLISITVTGGAVVGGVSVTVSDQVIQTYLNTYTTKSTLISSGQISSSYQGEVSAILGQAQSLYQEGLPDNATALLNVIQPSLFPNPPSSSLQTDLILVAVILAVLVVVFAMLAMRRGSKSGYMSGVITDVEKEVASLEVKAAQYDKSLADQLKSIRDKLSEAT